MTRWADPSIDGGSVTADMPRYSWTQRVRIVLPSILVLSLLVWVYYPLVIGRVLAGGDLQLYFHPYWEAIIRSLRAHQLPLWSADLFMGVPLMANSQTGIWYPPHWLLWAVGAGAVIDIPRVLHLCVLLHVALAALTMMTLARARGWSPWGAAMAGLSYAGSGFLAAHLEHLNQLEGWAWLPLILLPPASIRIRRYHWLVPRTLSVVALAMMLLAGHLQVAFIGSLCAFVLAVFEKGHCGVGARRLLLTNVTRRVLLALTALLLRLGPFALAGILAAVQLAPTLALMTLSGRSGGLDWRQAISFSLVPWKLWRTLLPPYLVSPLLPEGVGYLGLLASGLALLGGWWAVRTHRREITWLVWLGGLGLFLALGGYNPLYLLAVRLNMPGFVHFRAPARFMGMFVLAGSLLAGKGLSLVLGKLHRLSGTAWQDVASAGVVMLVGLELAASGWKLPYGAATAARAYTDMRPAVAQLQAAIENTRRGGEIPGRFLSVSRTLFELGDRGEIEAAYSELLDKDALYAYLVATKHREVLTPNLPMVWDVPSVDGYDGGLLPTRYYHLFSTLLVPGGTADGRLRENLPDIPEDRWLDLMGVQFLMTDRTGDAWIEGVLYDRQFRPRIAYGEVVTIGWLPADFRANALVLLHEGGAGDVEVGLADGRRLHYQLLPSESGDQAVWLRWEGRARVISVHVRCVDPSQDVRLNGASLVDERVGAFYPLVLSSNYRLVHAGDVKLYERLAPTARAFFVTSCQATVDDLEALRLMDRPDFDPRGHVVLTTREEAWEVWCRNLSANAVRDGVGTVTLLSLGDTEMVLEVSADSPGVVLVSSAWDPGWRVQIEGLDGDSERVPLTEQMLRADVMFGAIPVAEGRWRIRLVYDSPWLTIGAGVSLFGIVLLGSYGLAVGRRGWPTS